MTVLITTAAAFIVWRLWPWWRRRQRCAHTVARVDAALPDVIDLITIVVSSGGTVADALVVVAENGPAPTAPMFRRLLEHADAGQTLTQSLARSVVEFTPEYRSLMSALLATERDGVPIASLMLRLGDEAQSARRRRDKRRSRSLPVQLLFPLVCCSLPAVLLGAVVPLVLVTLGSLRL